MGGHLLFLRLHHGSDANLADVLQSKRSPVHQPGGLVMNQPPGSASEMTG